MDFEKAIERIEKSSYVGIIAPNAPSMDCMLAAEALARVLEDQGKAVGFLSPLPLLGAFGQETFRHVSSPSPLPKEFIVSVDTSQSPIAELRYEKLDGTLEIVLSPQKNSIQENSISYRLGKIRCDLIVNMGIASEEHVKEILGHDQTLLSETPVISIYIKEEPALFGETILSEESSFSEIVSRILGKWSPDLLTPGLATLLLAGVMSQTDNFSNARVNDQTFMHASDLLRAGGDMARSRRFIVYQTPVSLAQLFGRASVRSKLSADNKVLWSFLTHEDFEKTGRTEKDIIPVLFHLVKEFSLPLAIVLFWQDPHGKTIKGILQSADTHALPNIAARVQGIAAEGGIISLQNSFANFQEAEDTLAPLLREAL